MWFGTYRYEQYSVESNIPPWLERVHDDVDVVAIAMMMSVRIEQVELDEEREVETK